MTAIKARIGGAWVDTTKTGKARIGGAWVDYGPASTYETITWPTPPSLPDGNDAAQTYNLGLLWSLSGSGGSWIGNVLNPAPLSHVAPAGGTNYTQAWNYDTSTLLTPSQAILPAAGGGKQEFLFDTPVAVTLGVAYMSAFYTQNYAFLANPLWDEVSPSGRIHADRGILRTDNSGSANIPDTLTDSIYFISPMIVFPS